MGFTIMEIEASPSSTKNNEKIDKVLQKFLEPDFKIRNDVYLNLFLTHLVDNGKTPQMHTNKLLKERFCQWIIQASALWDQEKGNPPPAILSFALNLASQLSIDEQIFIRLNCQNVFESLVGVAQANPIKDSSVTLGFVTLLCSFLEHKNGVQWVMATTHWTDVINLGLTARTMYIRKKAYQFVIKLLDKTISFNRNFGLNLVGILVKPLKDVFRSLPSSKTTRHTQIENGVIFESLKPTLEFITEVIEALLKILNKNVVHLFFALETSETIQRILLISQNGDFSFKLLKIQFLFLFYKMCGYRDEAKVAGPDLSTRFDTSVLFDLIKHEMDKDNVRCVIKICDYAFGLYCSLAPHLPMCVRGGKPLDFQTQLLMFQLMPIIVFSFQILCEERAIYLVRNEDFRETYYNKLLRSCTVRSIDMCYKWMDPLKLKPDLVDDVTFSLQYIAKLKKLINKELAGFVFPPMVYSLSDALTVMNEAPHIELSFSCLLYLKTLVETLVDLVETFDLTWKESVETICVMDLACDFVQYPYWPDKMIVIQGLKLLNTAIAKYMSPNMVLLIHNTKDSKVSQTGSLLYAKCHDSSWEIRDSALEVVYTLSLNANTKFPAYTNILLDAELPQLVVNMALKDDECYVRVTAFKCLQELIQIAEIWDMFLEQEDTFLENMLNVFENETEGIVRKEAATLIHKIDKFQNYPEEMLPRLYDVMTHAAIGDLHWEVKYNALDFWFNSWEEHLIQQGMIDEMFPSHTFSKEHRKIVALNEAEVRKRIIKVLNQMSHIGGLYVMKCAVQDDCDVEVSKKATDFTVCMVKMFRVYKIPCENVDLSEPPSPTVLHIDRPQLFEPVSPASTLPSPADVYDLGSPQFLSNSPFFDPVSPFSPPFSPSPDCISVTPLQSTTSQTSTSQDTACHPQQTPPPYVNPVHQQEVSYQNMDTPNDQHGTLCNNTLGDIITSCVNAIDQTCYMDMVGGEDVDFGNVQLGNVANSDSFDPVRREKMLDELLNSNDVMLLQGICNPTDQVTNNSTQMKTKTYLAPSEYLKFAYNEVETHAIEKTQWLKSLDEFESLLDDILKEYNIVADVNVMDCY